MPRVLLVTYEFPPRGGPGVQRPLKLAKYWARAGVQVDVLTVRDPVTAITDGSLLDELPDSVFVHRAWSLEPNRLIRFGRRMLGKRTGTAGSAGSARLTAAPSGLVSTVQSVFVPDEKRYWLPWALRKGRTIGDGRVDAIISTGPPHTAHLVASRLASQWGVPHVVDLRDPWVGNVNRRYATGMLRRADVRLETRVVERAAAVVCVTEGMCRELVARHPRLKRVRTIFNGYDPEDLMQVSTAEHVERTLRFIHVGTFSGDRRPDEFLAGLVLAEAGDSRIAKAVEVVFVGAGPEVEEAARKLGVRSRVFATGYLGHKDALSQLAAADVALMLLSEGRESEVSLTGKVFEYLGLSKPILGVVGAGEVEALLEGEMGCWLARPSDPGAISATVAEVHARWSDAGLPRPASELTQRFSRLAQAEEYLALIEEVVREHPTPRQP